MTEFFDPERLYTMMFGDDGQGGAFGKLEERLDEHNTKMGELENTIINFQGKFEIYNNLHEKTRQMSREFKEHVKACSEIQKAKETAQQVTEAYAKGLTAAEKKGADETKKTIKDTVWLIIQILTALSIATGVISFFLGLWNF